MGVSSSQSEALVLFWKIVAGGDFDFISESFVWDSCGGGKAFNLPSIYVPTLNYGQELSVVTERMK